MRYWWSREYNRPYNDPILKEYTLEELSLEYYDKSERAIAAEEKVKENGDKIEEKRVQDALDWAEAEEQKELEALKQQDEEVNVERPVQYQPSEKEQDWIKRQLDEQMKKMKEQYGDEFGEDIVGSFEDE